MLLEAVARGFRSVTVRRGDLPGELHHLRSGTPGSSADVHNIRYEWKNDITIKRMQGSICEASQFIAGSISRNES